MILSFISVFLIRSFTVDNRNPISLSLEVKIIVNTLYTNAPVDSFAKLYEPQNRIIKKEILIHFMFPYSQFVPLSFGNLQH